MQISLAWATAPGNEQWQLKTNSMFGVFREGAPHQLRGGNEVSSMEQKGLCPLPRDNNSRCLRFCALDRSSRELTGFLMRPFNAVRQAAIRHIALALSRLAQRAPCHVRFRTMADIAGFWPGTVCPLMTQSGPKEAARPRRNKPPIGASTISYTNEWRPLIRKLLFWHEQGT